MRKITKKEIEINLNDLCTYQELRSYLVGKIAKLRLAKTSRRKAEMLKLIELQEILDMSAVLCNYSDTYIETDHLYSLLS
jgi:hypothetical protein